MKSRPEVHRARRRSRPGSGARARSARRHVGAPETHCWEQLLVLRPAVLAFLRRRCRDEHQAEDLAQETLLRAARHGTHFDRVQRPISWALQIAANVHLDHARKESWLRLTPPDHAAFLSIAGTEPIPGEERECGLYQVDGDEVEGSELLAAVRAVWGTLLRRDQVVLSAFYGEEGGPAAAAAACGVSRDLVKVRVFRARRRLHAAIVKHLGRG